MLIYPVYSEINYRFHKHWKYIRENFFIWNYTILFNSHSILTTYDPMKMLKYSGKGGPKNLVCMTLCNAVNSIFCLSDITSDARWG